MKHFTILAMLLLALTGCSKPTFDEAQQKLRDYLKSDELAAVRSYTEVADEASRKMMFISAKTEVFGVKNDDGDPGRQRQEMLKAKVAAAEVRRMVDKIKSEKLLDNAVEAIESNKSKIEGLLESAREAAKREGQQFDFPEISGNYLRKGFDKLESDLVKVETETNAVLGIR